MIEPMKKTFLLAFMASLAIATIGAGARIDQPVIHVVGKTGPPTHPAANPVPSNPPLTGPQLLAKLKLVKFQAKTLSGPLHFSAANPAVSTQNFMVINGGLTYPVPNGGSIMFSPQVGAQGVTICHMATENVPLLVDFQISSVTGSATFITQVGSNSQTWTISSPTHAVVSVYPTTTGNYFITWTRCKATESSPAWTLQT
jgi:hypothetical protein